MQIEIAERREAWDSYVQRVSPESLYHYWVWGEIIGETFGHRSYYLTAEDKGTTRGILPLVAIRSWLFGNCLISVPFSSYGGVVADADAARAMLLARAIELARELGVGRIELRQGDDAHLMTWNSTCSKVAMEIHLPPKVEDYWCQLSPGRRKRIRYILRHGFRTQWGGVEELPAFYKVFGTNMRHLGTPVYPYKFFDNQFRKLSGRIRILSLWDGGEAVAASILIAHAETLELPWVASLPESRKKEAPTVMYWTFIRKAIEEGFKKLDLGRCTPGSGNYEFKRHWKPVERPLHWYYWLAPGTPMPKLQPDNAKFKLARNIWMHMPLAVTNSLGPRLVRSIP